MALKKKTAPVDVKTDEDKVTQAAPTQTTETTAAPVTKTEEAPVAQTEAAPLEGTVVEKTINAPAVSEQAQAPATVQSSTTAMQMGGTAFDQSNHEKGLDGLEVGYFSYPTVKLPGEGVFETSTDLNLGKWMDVKIISTKAKFIVKPSGAPDSDKRMAYSYDQVLTTDSKTMDDLKAEWGVDAIEFRKYLDVPCQLVACDEAGDQSLVGSLVMLSIPKTGIQPLGGLQQELQFLGKGDLTTIITKCKVGEKVKTVDNPFYPWKFEYVSAA